MKPITTRELLENLLAMARTDMTPDGHAKAIQIAYDLGVNQGHLNGAEQMGDELMKKFDESFSQIIERFKGKTHE